MSALSFKITTDTAKINNFRKSLERLYELLEKFPSKSSGFKVINRHISDLETRVDQAIRKIAKMQQQAAESAAKVATPATPTATPSNSKTTSGSQTAQAEAAAYKDLIGTIREASAQKKIYTAQIELLKTKTQALTAEYNALSKAEKNNAAVSQAQKDKRLDLSLSIAKNKEELALYQGTLKNIIKTEQFAEGSINKMSQSLTRMKNIYRNLSAAEREGTRGQTMLKNIDTLDTKIKELDAAMGVHTRNVGNYASGFNMLGFQIQQVARELPSLAYGPQIFFSAISNNLPIFTDELARARKEYDELQKSGKKGTPVWKQVLSSLFSWQTAITTGIMLLVMYGDEIWDWTKNLFSAKKGVDEFNISLKEMTEIEKDGRAQMVRTRFELKSVIDEIKNFTGSKEQEKAKVEELNRKYGESFGYYKTLSEWYDTLIQKSEDYVQVLLHQANVQNLVKKAAEADEEVNKIKAQKPEEAESAMGFFGKWGQYIMQSSMAESGQFYDAQAAIKKHDQEAYDILLKNAENKRDGYLKKAEEEVKKAAEAAKKGNIGGHIDPKQPGKNPEAEAKQRLATERRLAQELAALQAENRKEEIDRMQAGTEKKLAQIEYDYNARKEEINRQEASWKRENKEAGLSTGDNGLTREQQDELEKARASNTASRKKAEADVYREEAEAMRDYLKEYGTFQQQKLAREYLKKYSCQIESWGPFAEGRKDMFTNPVLTAIGAKYGKTAAQTALRFLLQSDVVIIPKSVHKERMQQNFELFDFTLSAEDMAAIEALDGGESLFFSHYDPKTVEWFMSIL